MVKCLLKELKESIDNDSLPIYGELKFSIAVGTFSQSIFSNGNTQVSGSNNVSFKNAGGTSDYTNPFTLTSEMNQFKTIAATEAGTVKIDDRYKLVPRTGVFGYSGVYNVVGGVENLYIPSNTTYFRFQNCRMEDLTIKEIIDTVLSRATITDIDLSETINANDNTLQGDINDLAIPGIKNIGLSGCKLVTGDIASIASIATLINIALANTNVYGTIESFVAGQRIVGNTTGSVSGNSAGWGKVTFNGATTHAKGTVSWTASTITMDGVTINA